MHQTIATQQRHAMLCYRLSVRQKAISRLLHMGRACDFTSHIGYGCLVLLRSLLDDVLDERFSSFVRAADKRTTGAV